MVFFGLKFLYMRPIYTLPLCFLLLCFNLHSQENEKDTPKKEKKEKAEIKFAEDDDPKVFRIGLNFAPQIYFFNDPSIPNVESTYRKSFNMDFALVFTAKFGKVFEAKTGIGYSSKNFKREEECLICGTEITEGNSFKVNYIELPLLANLYFYNSRLDAYGIIGIRNSFLVGAKNIHKDNIEESKESVFNVKDDFAKYLLGIQTGLGINYNLTYSLSFTGEILYNFSPMVFELTTGLKQHSLGFNFGINLKF